MKKNPIIFIAMLVALAFTSCQMNTDDTTVPYVPETPTYTITVTATHGTVTLSKTEAKAGETITVTGTTPKSGYEFDLGKVTIKDANGKDISVNATTKSFVMPASNVTITVEFVKITDGGSPTTPTTPTTDGGEDNGNVVYGSKRIILPTVEHGTIKITNKSGTKAYKDGNTVLSNAGADVGDVIEIKLIPDTGYNYFAYENTLTVTSSGSVSLTKSDDTTYTFTMPNNDVEVNELPSGFEKNYSATFSTSERTNLRFYYKGYSGFMSFNTDKLFPEPGTKVYVLTYMQNLIEPVTVTEVTETIRSNYSDGYVTIDGVEIRHTVKNVYKYYSFLMPRENITLKFVETNQQ